MAISLSLALAISVVANLLTRPVENLLAKLSLPSTDAAIRKLEARLKEVKRLLSPPSNLWMHVLSAMLRALLCMFVASAIAHIEEIPAIFRANRTTLSDIMPYVYLVDEILVSVLYLIAVNIAIRTLMTLRDAKCYPELEGEVREIIASLRDKTSTETPP